MKCQPRSTSIGPIVFLHGKGIRSLVGSTQMLPASNSRRSGLQSAKLKKEVSNSSFSVPQSVNRVVVARENQKQNYPPHRRGCSCSPQLRFQPANRRCFKRSPKWTVAYLSYHGSIADSTSQHRRIQDAAFCHYLQVISSYQATSDPGSFRKSPYRASCIQPLVKLKRTLMVGTMASNAITSVSTFQQLLRI
jgi:hypothetical protein